ncbi:ATP-binding cassette domain-containing protein [Vagococcus xieshaowenii]|uniref:ABC transporter ATP-binding protein/permease n=1 Tax=Vagococcus xieshaowenii TaxID=2562451 RepID=A0AAJ5JM69_9ENTE|nr:ABC transporter ATP-binding protein/permease [Vagococcus xieshaowenii]QCA28556.1 ABC transporter ATP-binding protein/permease [Vagococcus xieshaowenii]TFZ40636.1 ABC transporter ATP-binding protein/permease [Vagococcus xieshaowenii]
MLELKNIRKTYQLGGQETVALEAVNLSFNRNQFVSILGQSGSGKTTLLNIIGGLDQYTSGDLIVEGTSTKTFKDKDWDSYRNTTIGFVFQSYNLISHLSVLENVKMALSLTGVSAKESEKRALEALTDVGLAEHARKRPNQLSGGQMQRVAIARALVNNPKILLADEPTGALDSKTSIQIMELIKKISHDRLVIMVTHNPELAEQYSDRIIRVADGSILEDTAPVMDLNTSNAAFTKSKTAMSFFSAIKSSMKNLLTKKTRTALVTLAGSIGIISIGLVLALSNGMKSYIDDLQRETLSGIPITISQTSAGNFEAMSEASNKETSKKDQITIKEPITTHQNIYDQDVLGKGESFIQYLEREAKGKFSNLTYDTGYQLNVLTTNQAGDVQQVKKSDTDMNNPAAMFSMGSLMTKLPENGDNILSQYEVIDSTNNRFSYPTKPDELVLFVNYDQSLNKDVAKALGLSDDNTQNIKTLLGKELRIISNDEFYEKSPMGNFFINQPINQTMYDNGLKGTIVAIMKPKEASASLINASIGYTATLEEQMLAKESSSNIVKFMKEHPTVNALSPSSDMIDEETNKTIMQKIGGNTSPTNISIYPSTFDEREAITNIISNYNNQVAKKFGEKSKDYTKYMIEYTDMAEMMTGMMTTMLDTITVILTAFAAISLIVSSVMIGILTYVSVVERTKEIGIMRALGARKKDITRIFNAEAGLIGLISGILGVIITILLTIPINAIVGKLIDMDGFKASLKPEYAIALIILSVILTLVAGFIPSKGAAKKDPVEALRTE